MTTMILEVTLLTHWPCNPTNQPTNHPSWAEYFRS